ncbi:MAG: cell wall hydrolase [Clostridia bacterium]|nr:cell wall hydrolase [Clostridia bacterium]
MKHINKIITALLLTALLVVAVPLTTSAATPSAPADTPGRSMIISTEDGYFYGYHYNSLTYVPLYIFADTFGGCIYGWSFKDGVAYAKADGLYLTAAPGDLYIIANERCFYTEQPVMDVNGTVYVPVSPMARAFGVDIEIASYNEINLWGTGRDYCAHADDVYVSDELYWLSRIISAEAGGEPFRGQMAVGNVVINRMNHPSYPNTIYGVIFDRKYGTQFTPAANGTVYRTPTESAVLAAKACLDGYTLSEDMLFFLNPRIATNFWIVRSCAPIMSIGNHDFYG